MIENSYGKMNDTDWTSLVTDMYQSFQGSYTYTDPASADFEFLRTTGTGRPVWGVKGDESTIRGSIPWSDKDMGERGPAIREWEAGLNLTDEEFQILGLFDDDKATGLDAIIEAWGGEDEDIFTYAKSKWAAHKAIKKGMFGQYMKGIENGTLQLVDPETRDIFELPKGAKWQIKEGDDPENWFKAGVGEEYKGYSTQEIHDEQRAVGMLVLAQDLMQGTETDIEVTYLDEGNNQVKKILTIPPRQAADDLSPEQRKTEFKAQLRADLRTASLVGIMTDNEGNPNQNDIEWQKRQAAWTGTGGIMEQGAEGTDVFGITTEAARQLATQGFYKWTAQTDAGWEDFQVDLEDLPWLAEQPEFQRMSGGWSLRGDVDTTGNGLSFEHVNADWLTDLVATNPDIVQSLFALINGGNFSPERQGAAVSAGGDGSGSGAENFGQMIGQNLPAILSLIKTVGPSVGGSDPGMKENIKLLRQSPAGLNIYEFTYKPGLGPVGVYEGVMSTEIPSEAVLKVPGEFDRVFYNKIDVDFKRVG